LTPSAQPIPAIPRSKKPEGNPLKLNILGKAKSILPVNVISTYGVSKDGDSAEDITQNKATVVQSTTGNAISGPPAFIQKSITKRSLRKPDQTSDSASGETDEEFSFPALSTSRGSVSVKEKQLRRKSPRKKEVQRTTTEKGDREKN